jgi:hypothetical protein
MTRGERDVKASLEVHANGWPDFLLVAPDGVVSFVEVKDGRDFVRPNQALVHDLLRSAGFRVEVMRVEDVKRPARIDETDTKAPATFAENLEWLRKVLFDARPRDGFFPTYG